MRKTPPLILLPLFAACATVDPLPSWRDTETKTALLDFVDRVSDPASPDFVPAPERIATFDNDGTLWSEKPVYFQLLFAIDRVRALADEHPEWRTTQPFKAAIEGDLDGLAKAGKEGLLELVMATHANMTTNEFAAIVADWTETARHPSTQKPYSRMVYQPMLELLDHLRARGFEVTITSGGGVDFLRVWAEDVYGIPPENVVGSRIETKFEWRDEEPVLVRSPKLDFIDDGAGKPVGIYERLGRRPILAVGNSDGDLEMLQWITAGSGPRMGVLVHHTDAEREWAYDEDSHVGRLRFALDAAVERDWLVIDMASDWEVVFPGSETDGTL
ncbi:MAG: HAD family hydrolase [Planctomycetota bacterium]